MVYALSSSIFIQATLPVLSAVSFCVFAMSPSVSMVRSIAPLLAVAFAPISPRVSSPSVLTATTAMSL